MPLRAERVWRDGVMYFRPYTDGPPVGHYLSEGVYPEALVFHTASPPAFLPAEM
jgi:hypothetical protein